MYFKTKSVSGLQRLYLPTYPLNWEIPTVESIVQSPQSQLRFINHVTLNHKGLNWKIFRYKLNKDNYKSFVYAFAYQLTQINPTSIKSWHWQLASNTRRLLKALKRVNIKLSEDEMKILDVCLGSWKFILIVPNRRARYVKALNIANQLFK